MALVFGILRILERLNGVLLAIGRAVAIFALAVMVCLILGQVFFRYVLDSAPAWTEEGARFGMLWMTGLMAPLAYRQGGFVAIDMLESALPRMLASLLGLALLLLSLAVLLYALNFGLSNHVFSLTGRGTSPSLRVPMSLVGGENIRFRNSWAYASLALGLAMLVLVNVELILRQTIRLAGQGDRLTPLSPGDLARAD